MPDKNTEPRYMADLIVCYFIWYWRVSQIHSNRMQITK